MPDRFGPRGVIATVIPVQNSNMQPEYEALRPAGISNQTYRFFLEGAGDTPLAAALRVIPDTLKCWPDMIVVGNSVEMRSVSESGHLAYRSALQKAAGKVPVVTAAEACVVALRTLNARRIALLSPMSREHSDSAAAYYQAHGFEVLGARWFDVAKSEDIINVPRERVQQAFEEIAGLKADALLHVGGALPVVDMLEHLESRFGIPVVAVNAATYWYALRRLGVTDPIPGFGALLNRPDAVLGADS